MVAVVTVLILHNQTFNDSLRGLMTHKNGVPIAFTQIEPSDSPGGESKIPGDLGPPGPPRLGLKGAQKNVEF